MEMEQQPQPQPQPDYNPFVKIRESIERVPVDVGKKKKLVKILLGALGVLFIILVGLLLVSYVRFSALKQECQQKLDYWVNKPGCADTVPINMPNITLPTGGVQEPENATGAVIVIPVS